MVLGFGFTTIMLWYAKERDVSYTKAAHWSRSNRMGMVGSHRRICIFSHFAFGLKEGESL